MNLITDMIPTCHFTIPQPPNLHPQGPQGHHGEYLLTRDYLQPSSLHILMEFNFAQIISAGAETEYLAIVPTSTFQAPNHGFNSGHIFSLSISHTSSVPYDVKTQKQASWSAESFCNFIEPLPKATLEGLYAMGSTLW